MQAREGSNGSNMGPVSEHVLKGLCLVLMLLAVSQACPEGVSRLSLTSNQQDCPGSLPTCPHTAGLLGCSTRKLLVFLSTVGSSVQASR